MTRRDWDRARIQKAMRPTPPPSGGKIGHGQAPTPAQLHYLEDLAERAGETMPPALTRAQVGREIDRLKKKPSRRSQKPQRG